MRCLILNASNEFLSVVSWKRALRLLQDDKINTVDVIHWYENQVNSEKNSHKLPSVIRLRYFVKTRRLGNLNSPTIKNILVRDNFKCVYCNTKLSLKSATKDHVVPLSKKGPNKIDNIVASCKMCNGLKRDLSLKAFEDIYGYNLDRSKLRKLTDEEKINSIMKSYKTREKKSWLYALNKYNIDLY